MKKRICFLVDSIFTIGGVQRVTAVIAGALAEVYDVTILTFDKEESKNLTLYQLEKHPISYQFLSYPSISPQKDWLCKGYSYLYRRVLPQCGITSDLYKLSSFPKEKRQALINVLNKGNYDIIIAVHAFLAIRLATIRKQLKGVKTIGWIHNSFEALLHEGSPYLGSELKYHYGRQLQKLDNVIVLYQQDADRYKEAFGFKPTAIYNPLTLQPGEKSNGKNKRFLAVGRFAPQHKGFDLLIKAFGIFAGSNQDWTLDIVGEGPEKEKLQKMIDEQKQNARIKIHPFTNEIQRYYSTADIYVLSSRWEGMPLVLMEAMAHGLPIVSSDLPTSKEVLGNFGMFFHNGNTEELAQCLEDATHLNWQEKSEEALKIAKRFEIDHIIEQWIKILES